MISETGLNSLTYLRRYSDFGSSGPLASDLGFRTRSMEGC